MDVEGCFPVGCDYDIRVSQSPFQPVMADVPLEPVEAVFRILQKLQVIDFQHYPAGFRVFLSSQCLKTQHIRLHRDYSDGKFINFE